MTVIILKLVLLACLAAPITLAAAAFWRRRWPATPVSEAVLVGLIATPHAILALVVTLGKAPWARPLDSLAAVQYVMSAGCVVFLAFRRRDIGALWRDGWARVVRPRSGLAWSQALCVGIGAASLLGAFAYGAWTVPWHVDELSYHLPQALQPLQDGRIGPVQANVVWADSYPRAGGLLYFWTIALSGTDAGIHPVNAYMAFVLVVATYVASMRLRLSRGWAAAAAGLVPTAPIVLYNASSGYVDQIVGASLAVGIAFALPERDGDGSHPRWGWRSTLPCLAGFLLALWCKIVAVCVTGLVMTFRFGALAWERRRHGGDADRPMGRVQHPIVFAAAGVAMLALASVPYVQAARQYGSPTYPVELRIGPVVLCEGPMKTAHFQRNNTLPVLDRFTVMWGHLNEPLTNDSPGGFGHLFAFAMIASTAWLGIEGLRRGSWPAVMLGAILAGNLVFPEHHVPRYAIATLLAGSAAAGAVGGRLRAAGVSWALVLAMLAILNVRTMWKSVDEKIRWQREFNVPLLTEARNRTVADLVHGFSEQDPSPRTRRRLYELVPAGGKLVTTVNGLFANFYDRRFSYHVEHRPARAWGVIFDASNASSYSEGATAGWLEGLRRDKIDVVMVYATSAEARALSEPGSGYSAAYTQPPEDGNFPITLYVRNGIERGAVK